MMRKLLYVPIIHVDTDMGSIAPAMDQRSAAICGRERWEKHKQIVITFWDQIEAYFKKLDAGNLKIYQDGLMVAGELGQKIIAQGAKQGSRNYLIVLDLMKRGGEIRKTEDIALLKEEYNRILKLAQSKSPWEKSTAYIGYEEHKDRLMEKRDRFIANTISETLNKGETGILFIGAYHDVSPHLDKDVAVEEIKKCEKIRDYFKVLISGGEEEGFEQLAEYLVSKVQGSVIGDR